MHAKILVNVKFINQKIMCNKLPLKIKKIAKNINFQSTFGNRNHKKDRIQEIV